MTVSINATEATTDAVKETTSVLASNQRLDSQKIISNQSDPSLESTEQNLQPKPIRVDKNFTTPTDPNNKKTEPAEEDEYLKEKEKYELLSEKIQQEQFVKNFKILLAESTDEEEDAKREFEELTIAAALYESKNSAMPTYQNNETLGQVEKNNFLKNFVEEFEKEFAEKLSEEELKDIKSPEGFVEFLKDRYFYADLKIKKLEKAVEAAEERDYNYLRAAQKLQEAAEAEKKAAEERENAAEKKAKAAVAAAEERAITAEKRANVAEAAAKAAGDEVSDLKIKLAKFEALAKKQLEAEVTEPETYRFNNSDIKYKSPDESEESPKMAIGEPRATILGTNLKIFPPRI